MLNEQNNQSRCYRTRSQRVIVGITGVVFCGLMGGMLASANYTETRVLAVASLAVMIPVGIRLFRSRLQVSDEGVQVMNVFSTFELPWEDIEGFEIGRSGFFPLVCLIHLKQGGKRQATAIQERGTGGDGSAEVMVEELNAELAKRTGGGSVRPQVALDSR